MELTREQWWLLSDLSLSRESIVENVNGLDMFKLELEGLVEAEMISPRSFAFNVTPQGIGFAKKWRLKQVSEVVKNKENV